LKWWARLVEGQVRESLEFHHPEVTVMGRTIRLPPKDDLPVIKN
jgi:hypothetical protein